MKLFKQAQKYGAKVALVVPSALLAMSARAAGTSPVEDLFAAVDVTTVAASVLALGLAAIGIAMAFKGISLAKRGVKTI